MAIYSPTLILSHDDKELLSLLGQLLLASDSPWTRTNFNEHDVVLSNAEAERLLILLEQFANSKLFKEGVYFIEGVANGEAWTNDRLKEIYLSWRSRRGRTRVASTATWTEFVVRAGFNSGADSWLWPRTIRRSPVRPMSLEHFRSMEIKLTKAAEIHPRVRELIIQFVDAAIPRLDKLRNESIHIETGSSQSFVKRMMEDLNLSRAGAPPIQRRRIVALSTAIMDISALFATRDWTATGTISTLASVLPEALSDFPEK